MSIIHAFDNNSEEIIKPSYFAEPIEGFPKTIIVTFRPEIVNILKATFETEEIGSMEAAGVLLPDYHFQYRGHNLGLYMTTIGGPAAVGLMEEAAAKGAETFLFFGACGVLDKNLAAGRFIIPNAAYRDEGTSYHYMPPGDYVEIPTAKRLGEIFDELHLPYISGKIWTTDAFYRETRDNAEKRRKEGCIAVDMECASIMAAGQFRNIPVYQFVYAEDCLNGAEWDARTLGAVPESDYEKYLRIALETAIRL